MAEQFYRDPNLAVIIEEQAPPIERTSIFTTVATRMPEDQMSSNRADARWINGVRFRPWPRDQQSEGENRINDVTTGQLGLCDDENPAESDFGSTAADCERYEEGFCAFRVDVTARHSALDPSSVKESFSGQQMEQIISARLMERLEIGNSIGEDDDLCSSLSLYSRATTGGAVVLTEAGGIPMVQALAILEQTTYSQISENGLGTGTFDRRHTIIMSRGALTYLVRCGVLRLDAELDAWVTPNGNVVMADAGWQGFIGEGPIDGQEPLYLVPEIFYQITEPTTTRRAGLNINAAGDGGFTDERNIVVELTQRYAIVFYDPGAVRVAVGTYQD